jgi:glycosyltransferase involved in cell wall biosynthesis
MISFCITTKNEGLYVDGLLTQLVTMLDKSNGEDEIVIIDDYSDDEETVDILNDWRLDCPVIEFYQRPLQKDFGAHKNFGIEKCSKPWIFQIDADETLAQALEDNVHSVLLDNSEIELFLVPRVNIVHGITQEDVKRWGWIQNEKGWNMWPDFQTRIFQNKKNIKWQGKVHERIVGFKTWSHLPEEEQWSLYHIKEVERQRSQNDLYSTIR